SGHVKLNFSNLKHPVPQLDNYLTIEEYSTQNKEQYLWDICGGVEWNVLFKYGIPSKDAHVNRLHNYVLKIFEHLTTQELAQCRMCFVLLLLLLHHFKKKKKKIKRGMRIVTHIHNTLPIIDRVCDLWNFILKKGAIIRSNRLKCYHSKKTFSQDIIGMMLQVEFKARSSKKKDTTDNYISLPSWAKLNIRVDSTKEEFTHFLPLVINTTHGNNALPEIEKYLALLAPEGTFTPKAALETICELLNALSCPNEFIFLAHFYLIHFCLPKKKKNPKKIRHFEILMMTCLVCCVFISYIYTKQKCGSTEQSFFRRQNSAKGATASLTLGLVLLTPFVIIFALKEAQIRVFTASDSEARDRENLPNLGKVLMHLLLTPSYDWHSVSKPFFEELFCRDAATCVATHKQLEDLQLSTKERLDLTFGATEKSRIRVMLQYTFLHEFGRPPEVVIHKTLENYNHNYGGFTGKAPSLLQNACLNIVKCSDWIKFFHFLSIRTSESKVEQLLKDAISNAARKNYYQPSRRLAETTSRESPLRTRDVNGVPTGGGRRTLFVEGAPRGRGNDSLRGSRDGRQTSGRERFEDEKDSREKGFGRRGRGSEGRFGRDSDRRRTPREGDKDTGAEMKVKAANSGDQYPNMQACRIPQKQSQISKKLSAFLVSGLQAQGIEKWHKMQEEALPLLTLGKDAIILSPAGSGKSTLLVIAALYRLYVRKDPAHVIVICSNDDHCSYIYQLLEKIGQQTPDLKVRVLDERKVDNYRDGFSRGRNVFIG
ncbi:hypothetical protein RFI_27062, partial [Reticulomyxa filosa]